jgi:hypothetical protein
MPSKFKSQNPNPKLLSAKFQIPNSALCAKSQIPNPKLFWIWAASIIIPKNTKLPPFDLSHLEDLNELCFIFLQSLDAKIANKVYFLIL